MHDPASLAHAVRLSETLFLRFLAGFDDTNRTAQAPGLPNHLSWTLGHCALTMHRAADVVEGFIEPQVLPTGDWIAGDGSAGDPGRYDTESVCVGSVPTPEAKRYPRLARARDIFHAGVERLATTASSASPQTLAREIRWGKAELAAGDLVLRVAFHNGLHAGQLVDLRRALGLGRAIP